MRKVLYGVGIFVFLCLLCAGYYGSYKVSDMKVKMDNLQAQLDAKEEQELQQAAASSKIITKDTQCTIEEYDKISGELKESTRIAADSLQGMERKELEDFLQKSQNMYYEYALVAFSPEHVVIRQTRTDYETYYLVEEEGMVAVYKGDKETLYEPTQISVSSLPQLLQEEIKSGKYVDSQEELYNFLENYSS